MNPQGTRFLKPAVLPRRFTLGLSLFLLVEGAWGLITPVVFGVLTTNTAHASVHLILAVTGLIALKRGFVKGYLGFAGSVFVVVSVLWLLPATRGVPAGLLNMNLAVAILNLLIGIAGIVIVATARPRWIK